MPFVNRQGHIAHGVAGSGACLDNTQFDTGGDACFVDARTIVYQHVGVDGAYVALYDLTTKQSTPILPALGANVVRGGGGVWAAWLAGVGLYSSCNFRAPLAGLVGVSLDGAIAYTPNQQDGEPVVVREQNGDEWTLTPGPVLDAHLLDGRRAVFADYTNTIHAVGLPAPIIIGGVGFRPRAAYVNDEWWIVYFHPSLGVIAHPFSSTYGYVVVPPGDAWHDASAIDGQPNILDVAWSTTQGETPGSVFADAIDVTARPRTDLKPITPPEPTLVPPCISIDVWTLDALEEGREIIFSDAANPDLGYLGRVWVEGGAMYASIANVGGRSQSAPLGPIGPPPSPQDGVYLKSQEWGSYLSVGEDWFVRAGNTLQRVFIEGQADGRVAIKMGGYYVAAEGDGRLKADRRSPGDWEFFTLVPQPSHAIGLQSWQGLYISVSPEGIVLANQPELSAWERLVLVRP